MKWMRLCVRPWFCSKALLIRATGLMICILVWYMPLVQDQSIDLLLKLAVQRSTTVLQVSPLKQWTSDERAENLDLPCFLSIIIYDLIDLFMLCTQAHFTITYRKCGVRSFPWAPIIIIVTAGNRTPYPLINLTGSNHCNAFTNKLKEPVPSQAHL